MKRRDIGIRYTRHFWERSEGRNIDLAPLIDIYPKAIRAKIGDTIIGENQFSKIVAQKVTAKGILLITAYKKRKPTSYLETLEKKEFKPTQMVIRYTDCFREKIVKRNINLVVLLDIYSKAAQAKIGDFIIQEIKESKIVARKVTTCKVVLITVNKKCPIEEVKCETI